jgi:hypothetical protein
MSSQYPKTVKEEPDSLDIAGKVGILNMKLSLVSAFRAERSSVTCLWSCSGWRDSCWEWACFTFASLFSVV